MGMMEMDREVMGTEKMVLSDRGIWREGHGWRQGVGLKRMKWEGEGGC